MKTLKEAMDYDIRSQALHSIRIIVEKAMIDLTVSSANLKQIYEKTQSEIHDIFKAADQDLKGINEN